VESPLEWAIFLGESSQNVDVFSWMRHIFPWCHLRNNLVISFIQVGNSSNAAYPTDLSDPTYPTDTTHATHPTGTAGA
jgi:hypothetical protein